MSLLNKYFTVIEKLLGFLPRKFTPYVITFLTVVFGVTVKGEWVLIVVHLMRQFGFIQESFGSTEEETNKPFAWSLEYFRFQNIHYFFILCNATGFIMYFGIGGFLHWHWYVRQRERAEEWKCQEKWLSPELELHSILYGCRSLLFTNVVTSMLACYIYNGGYTTIYYKFDHYSWSWYFLQWPIIFCYQDYMTYWLHRLYHTPWLYKNFHKAHHKYIQPTAFSVTAIHPVEIMHIQLMSYSLPMIVVPCHWSSITFLALYTYYNGMIDHSGIDFKAPWWQPWRPDTIFHDNHHQYFHVNFGFNCFIWDKIHGTYRQTDRIYSEEIFYGKGKALAEASDKEFQEEMLQRLGENLKAHRHLNPLIQKSVKVQ